MELQIAVSCHVGAGNLNPGPLEEQSVLSTAEPFLALHPLRAHFFPIVAHHPVVTE